MRHLLVHPCSALLSTLRARPASSPRIGPCGCLRDVLTRNGDGDQLGPPACWPPSPQPAQHHRQTFSVLVAPQGDVNGAAGDFECLSAQTLLIPLVLVAEDVAHPAKSPPRRRSPCPGHPHGKRDVTRSLNSGPGGPR